MTTLPTKSVFLDMDEVLTDFRGGACELLGFDRGEIDRRCITYCEWSMTPVMRITLDQFWEPIHKAGTWFWEELAPLPWAMELVEAVRLVSDDWHVVSAPSRCETSYIGKIRWLKKFFGTRFDRFVLTPHKHIFAKPGAILIDDRKENIDNFAKAGGKGILFPSCGNHLHAQRHEPLKYVFDQLGG